MSLNQGWFLISSEELYPSRFDGSFCSSPVIRSYAYASRRLRKATSGDMNWLLGTDAVRMRWYIILRLES